MPTFKRTATGLGLLAVAGAIAAVGSGPLLVGAADHLDAPTAKSDARIDITDIYAFRSTGGTTLVLNVNPLKSPADTKGARFNSSALYQMKVDTNLNGFADIAYRVRFGNTRMTSDGAVTQSYIVKRATGAAARADTWTGAIVARGYTTAYGRTARIAPVVGGGKVFAGPRDDPFYFDLPGFVEFKKQLLAGSTDLGVLTGGFTGADTFAGTNISSIAIELPNVRLGGSGRTVGYWATTSLPAGGGYVQVERMGRPAINTVFNNTNAEKEAANRLSPNDDRAFDRDNVLAVLNAIGNVLDANSLPAYTAGQKSGIASVLLPDTLTVKLGSSAGFLNGRKLADDVINAEFSLLTNGNITSDGVDANDKAFRASFPYLANPH
jgi:hypothetical protein